MNTIPDIKPMPQLKPVAIQHPNRRQAVATKLVATALFMASIAAILLISSDSTNAQTAKHQGASILIRVKSGELYECRKDSQGIKTRQGLGCQKVGE